MRKILGVFLVVGYAALAETALGFSPEAPLPDDTFVTEPRGSVPDHLKPFAGKWTGNIFFASIHLPHVIVVERIEPMLVWAVWSLGLTQYAGGPGAWYRVPMRVQNDTLIASGNRGRLTYRLRGNDEIEVSGTQAGGYLVQGTLRRESMLVKPFTEVEPATYWPINIAQLRPEKSTISTPALWPEPVIIVAPPPGLFIERTKWLGKWSGWSCQYKCEAKLAVLEVTDKTAKILELFTTESAKATPIVRQADFVGEELVVHGQNYRMSYRMRPTGEIEMLRAGTNFLGWGVLTREP